MIHRSPEGRAVLDGDVVDAAALLIPWADPAAQWGLGVFATIAVRDSSPQHLDEHLARLFAAARRLGVPLPVKDALARAALSVAAGTTNADRWLKLLVSRSGRWAVFAGPHDPAEAGKPVTAVVLPWRQHRLDPSAGLKTTGYAASLIGLEEAKRRGADEGIWLNDRGHVIGACTANLFAVRGRAVTTPALSEGARDGVTRGRAIPLLRAWGYSIRVSKLRPAGLRAADEVFLTSSLGGVRSVTRIDGRDIRGGRPGPVGERLAVRMSAVGVASGVAAGAAREGA